MRFSPRAGSASRRCCLSSARYVPRAPSPEAGATRLRVMSRITSEGTTPPSSLLRAHAPHHVPLTDLGLHPIPRVLAGCGEPLLEGGGSRRYLRHPCIGAWSRTPPRSPGAHARCFPVDIGLTSRLTRSARETLPAKQRQQGQIYRGCRHSVMFRLPCLLGPQVAPTAVDTTGQPGRLRHAMDLRLPSGTVISLRA